MFEAHIAAMTLIGSDKHSHWGSLQRLHPRPQIQEGIFDSFGFGLSDCCVMDMRLRVLILNGWWKTQIRRRFASNLESLFRPTSSVGNREQYETGNSTVTPVVSNLRIDPALVDGYLPFAHFFPSSVCSTY